MQQPGPATSPGAEMARELAKMQAEFAKAQAEIAREQKTEVVRTPSGRPGISITGPGGEAIMIDPNIVREAIAGMTAPPPPPPRDMGPPDSIVAIIIISILASTAVLFPIARAIGRRLDGKPKSALPASDVTNRLDRIENAVESIAVEVERISEGQRFTTKLLSDRQGEALLVTRGMNDAR